MIVYTVAFHGGTEVVEKPEIRSSPRNLDFGVGFYTTQSREQAARWAERQRKVRLRTERLFNQLTFKTEKALAYCRFVSSESIGEVRP